jgi:hypothetical protein
VPKAGWPIVTGLDIAGLVGAALPSPRTSTPAAGTEPQARSHRHDGHDRHAHVHRHDGRVKGRHMTDHVERGERHNPNQEGAVKTAASLSAAAVRYQRVERTALRIETQEGDVVRLKISVKDALSAQGASIADGETVVSELSVRASSTTRLRISVQGELNDEELAAIRSVVEQAGALANDFFDSGTAEAAQLASTLELNAEQLAQVRFRLSLRESLTYTQLGVVPLAPASPAAPAVPASPAAGSTAAEGEPAFVGEAVAQSPPAAVQSVPAPPGPLEAEPTDPGVPAIDAPANDLLGVFDAIATFLRSLLDALSVGAPAEGSPEPGVVALRYDVGFKLRVFQSILVSIAESSDETDSEEILPAPVDDALDRLAAEHEPPLEVVA